METQGALSTMELSMKSRFVWLGLACALWSCAPDTPAPKVATQPVKAGSGSLAPHFCAFADSLYLSWVKPAGDSGFGLWYIRQSGSGWEPGVFVTSGLHWMVNGADVPKVLWQKTSLTAVWLEKFEASSEGYGVKFARLPRGQSGDTVSGWLHADTSASEHGFVSLAALPQGETQAFWLDGRETLSGGATSLRTARITDSGVVEETVLDERVCDCCPTAAVRCPDGSLLVAYRDRSPEEVRDIAVTRFVDGAWSAPKAVNRDEWKIAGCPVNGPALAASDSLVALAWFTMSGGVDPTVQVAFSRNGGGSFGKPVRVDKRHPEGHVDVTWLPDQSVWVVWKETGDSGGTLLARRVFASGQTDTAIQIAELAPGGSGVPTVAVTGNRAFVAWTEVKETSQIRITELRH
jgi:hypothetical protein